MTSVTLTLRNYCCLVQGRVRELRERRFLRPDRGACSSHMVVWEETSGGCGEIRKDEARRTEEVKWRRFEDSRSKRVYSLVFEAAYHEM